MDREFTSSRGIITPFLPHRFLSSLFKLPLAQIISSKLILLPSNKSNFTNLLPNSKFTISRKLKYIQVGFPASLTLSRRNSYIQLTHRHVNGRFSIYMLLSLVHNQHTINAWPTDLYPKMNTFSLINSCNSYLFGQQMSFQKTYLKSKESLAGKEEVILLASF